MNIFSFDDSDTTSRNQHSDSGESHNLKQKRIDKLWDKAREHVEKIRLETRQQKHMEKILLNNVIDETSEQQMQRNNHNQDG